MNHKSLLSNISIPAYYICLIIIILTGTLHTQPPQSAIVPMTDSLYRVFTEHIRANADTEEGYNTLNNLVASDMITRRWARAAYTLDFNNRLFGEVYNSRISTKKAQLLGNMMTLTPSALNLRYFDYFATKLAPSDTGFVMLKKLSGYYINKSLWGKTLSQMEMFRHLYPHREEYFNEIAQIISAPKENLVPEPIRGINTKGGEWDPNPTPDGHYIFYSFNHPVKNNADVALGKMSDSGYVYIGVLKGVLSGPKNETIDNISYNTSKILLSGTLEGSLGEFDIFFAEREADLYSKLYHLPEPINTKYHEEGITLSIDESVMIFTSDRPGGIGDFHPTGKLHMGSVNGNFDLYISFKDKQNNWSDPVNIGPDINTPFAERSPYLHPDGKTLYFSSEGHTGLGGLDVFKSVRLDSTWQKWSKPINLGKEINTISDDWGYKIGLTGDTAYFAALNRTIGEGGYDIFSVKMPSQARPDTLILLNGQVLDSITKQPLHAFIRWEDLSNGSMKGELNTFNDNAFFRLPLKQGQRYGYYISVDGYLPNAGSLDLTETPKGEIIDIKILMQKLPTKKNESARYSASNIFFDYNKSIVRDESITEINQIVKILLDNPRLKVTVEGHTDEAGSAAYNQELSERRADAVKNILVKLNIHPSRVLSLGFGEKVPINEDSETGEENRRVEFVFMYE